MRVFVTGATGFIGSAVVGELIEAGHQVTGLARTKAAVQKLEAAGVRAHVGSIYDSASLRRGAGDADGVIHTAFTHGISQIPLATRLRVLLGGSPRGIVMRFLTTAVETDRRAIEMLGRAMSGPDRPLVAAFGTMAMKPGQLAAETDAPDPAAIGAMRGYTEQTLRDLASVGVRPVVIRLPPIVHGAGDRGGFATRLVQIARKKGAAATLGDGANRWPAVHRLDAARLFRLALEHAPAGATYHAVAEEGVPFREIAGLIGRRLNVPVLSKTPEQANGYFSWLGMFAGVDNPASSRQTQEQLQWHPSGPGLLADLDAHYFSS